MSDETKVVNARVPADVYRAVETMTGGPLGITQAQVVRMLLAEALAARGLLPQSDTAPPGDASRPTPAPAGPQRPGRRASGGHG